MPIVIGLGSEFELHDPLGLYKDSPGLGGTPAATSPASKPVQSPQPEANLPAGMRNNNPGNIKYRSDVPWKGLTGPSENTDQGDPQAVFESPELGMRAAYKLARNKYADGMRTANDIIAGSGGWTPGNKQAAANIARTMGVKPDEDLHLDDPSRAQKFLRALVTQEHGSASSAYTDDMISGVVGKTAQEMAADAASPAKAGTATEALDKLAGGSMQADQERPRVPNPDGEGLARLVPPEPTIAATDFLKKRLVGHSADHIDNMKPILQDRLMAMFEAAPPAIADKLGIYSGARSVERQTQLWDAAVKKYGSVAAARKWVAPPPGVAGSKGSRHNMGLAADLSYNGKSLKNAPAAVVNWIHENAPKFGLSFPLANENWHVEPVEARGGKEFTRELPQAAAIERKPGAVIVQSSDFKPSDPMGLYSSGANPLAPAPLELRPFHADERRPNPDGTYSTEISTTWQLPDGKWVNVPSLWMGAKGPKQFDPSDEDGIMGAMQAWEKKSGQQFPRFDSLDAAEQAAKARSAAGGAGAGQQTSSPVDQIWQGLEAKEPGRYKVINADEVENWRKEWEKTQPGQFRKGLTGALLDQNPELAGNALEAVSVLTDQPTLKGWADTVKDWGKNNSYKRIPKVGSIKDIRTDGVRNFLSDAMDYAAYSLGQGIGSMAPGLAIGGATAAVTVNPVAGFLAGESGPSYIQNLGDIYGSLRDDPGIQKRVESGELTQKQVAGWAAAAAVPMAALDTVSAGQVMNIAGGKQVKDAVVKRIAKGLAEGMLTEGSTEGLQEIISQSVQAALGSDTPLSERAISVADNAIGGALAGGAIGGASHIRGGGESAHGGAPVAADETAAPAPAQQPAAPATSPASSGPLTKALQEGQRRAAEARGIDVTAGAPAPALPAPTEISDMPIAEAQQSSTPTAETEAAPGPQDLVKGRTVRVDAEGIPPFMATVENIEGDEAVVYDASSGEVYQIPRSSLSVIAPSPGEFAGQDEIKPAEPMAAETKTELPPASEDKPASEAFPGPPEPGKRVIVNAKGVDRFAGRVERYEDVDGKTEAVVVDDNGTSMQVPIEDLRVSKLTSKEADAQEQKRNPPVKREKPAPTPVSRDVAGKTVSMPDEQHARLYDLGRTRLQAKLLGGTGSLDMDRASPAEQRKLADQFGVTHEALGQMADDYRYRVERAGKEARSQLPVKMHPVNERRLRQWQNERKKAEASDVPATDADWWDGELSAADRRAVLDAAGVKRSEKLTWGSLTPNIREKLLAQRTTPAEPAGDLVADAGNMIDEAAHEAAASPQNALPEPTDAQKEAGNYRKGHVRLAGLDISIENPEGSTRSGVSANGKPWSTKMKSHYGYFRGTVGRDKDHIDVFVKPGTEDIPDASHAGVFVVDQQDPATKKFDEHKVMMGFPTEEEARAAYLANYQKGWKGLGTITEASVDDFKSWLADGDTTRPFAKWRLERGRPKARPAVEAQNTFSPEQQRASDTYARIWDDAQAKPTEMSRTADWGKVIAQQIINPDRFHPVTEEANPLNLKIGDKVSIGGKPVYVLSIATHGGKGNEHQEVKAQGTDGYAVWYDLDRVDTPAGPGKAEPTVAEKVQSVREAAKPAEKPVQKKEWGGENKLVSRDRADDLRKRLSEKLRGQLNSGIDPEILAMGAELAAFHIEAGARRFVDFAHAVAQDLGTSVEKLRPFLRAWYNGARDLMEDSGIDIAGTDDAEAVRAALATLKEGAKPHEPSELDRPGASALEGAPAEAVRSAEGGRPARQEPARSGQPDLFGGEPARRSGLPAGRGMADDARELSDAAGRGPERRAADVAVAPAGTGSDVRQADGGDRVEYPKSAAATPSAERAIDYTLSDADEIGAGGAKAKFRNNVAAIKLLRALEEENRPATRDEQSVLAKWVGWGGLRNAFPREDGSVAKGWEKEAAELKELLSPDEFKAAESSTRNAHYTSPEVVRAIWDITRRLGFSGGQVLEPSVGAGNFIGLMPGRWRDAARVTGVELDHITGGIAKNLYPQANITAPKGFQDFTVPDGYFDLAIGNPPFGSERLYDPERRGLNKFSIHNFFFAKSVEALKPKGVLAMVVTNYFLDAQDARARAFLAARADLLGAIRLPNNAFLANAGTEVTTDIIVLQKRPEGTPAADLSWVEVSDVKDKNGNTVPLNRYFKKNPDMMLGEFGAFGTMYGREGHGALVARENDDLPELLRSATLKLPQDVMERPGVMPVQEEITVPTSVEDALVGSMFLDPDGNIWQRTPDVLGKPQASRVDLPNDTARERVAGMARVRDAFARLRRAQIDPRATDEKISNLRQRLNTVYDAFVKKHGPVNLDANRRLFRDDPTWPQISALEEGFDKGVSATVAKKTGETARPPSAKKAPIFTRRTQQPYSPPTSASSAKDALASVLADLGRVDLDAMSRLYGKSEQQIVDELGPLLYRTPAGDYETADHYLSGNVKQKLAEAQRAAEQDPAYRRNVAALQDVQPADIEPVDIDVKPGAPWLPKETVAAFADHIAETGGARAYYSHANAKWALQTPPSWRPTDAADAQWATDRTSLSAVLDAVLNGQTISVYDRMSDGKAVLNQPATDAAADKVAKMKAEWQRWIWEDDARREQLGRLYNDTFNTDVLRKYDGSHLSLPGKVGDDIISLRPHQKNFVWRSLQSPTALADHVVGAGKTFAVIASVMEKRRIGQARKPMLVVPNHLVGQWAADFVKLYPGAKVLAATKKDFDADNRKRLFARVATGDWDAVIVAHSSFGRIGVSQEFEQKFIEDQIADLDASMRDLREATGEKSRNVAQLAKWRENLNSKLKRLLDAGAKDEGLTFDEMGVDALYVDEAHEFKNLAFATSQTRVAGLGNPTGSQKAADLYMKINSVMERTGGRNIVFATGTPLSNTMAEMYTMQRYLDAKALKDLGISHFDAWARVFGEIVTDWELSPSGQYKLKSRFAKFTNMPELMQRYLGFADVITNDDIKAQLAALGKKLPLPRVKGGRPSNVVVERSPDQARYIGEGKTDADGNLQFPEGSLVWRAEHLPKRAEKGADNMLKVMSDARKAALDMRLIDPSYPDWPGSKVHVAADRMVDTYRRWEHKKGTQLVFIDLSTPKKAMAREETRIRDIMKKAEAGDEQAQEALDKMSPDEFLALDSSFSVYDDLRQKLIDRGVPPAEIAFIHDANTDLQKEELFGKVRSGTVRFLFGSTPKMGAGTNVQNRLVALHHLDAPWRPSDLEQRDGRGIRQGNELYAEDPDGFELEINRYATKNTLDARQWQTIEGKARFIQQVRKGGTTLREVEDIAGEAANAAEMKAAASGNPLILEEMDLRQKIRRLDGQRAEHDREQHRIRGRIRYLRDEKAKNAERLPDAEQDAAAAQAAADADFKATIAGKAVDKPMDMGQAVIEAAGEALAQHSEGGPLGSYAGFKLTLEYNHSKAFTVLLNGAAEHQVHIDDVSKAAATGVGMRIVNTVRRMVDAPADIKARNSEIDSQVPALERQIRPWEGEEDLAAAQKRHADVIAELRPKPSSTTAPASAEASIAEEPVAQLTGDELGVAFRGREDMPALRRAAARWYDEHLRGSTATMADGSTVQFSRKGMGKSTSAAKGDMLLRAVPSIRSIIERGRVVLREPGNREGIAERIVIAAPVQMAGDTLHLAVSVHKTAQGRYHYDFTFDRDMSGAAMPGVDSGGPAPTNGPLPSLEVPQAAPNSLNLFLWPEENKVSAGEDVSDRTDEAQISDADRQEIADIIRKVSGLDDVTFTRRIDLPNGAPGWGSSAPTTASGFYDPVADAITIATDSGSAHVAYHEAFHRLQRLFLSDKERAVLAAETGRLRRMVAGRMGREAQASRMSQNELQAEAFAIYSAGTGKVKPHVALRAAWDRIAKVIRQVRNLLAGRGFQTSEDVFDRAAAGDTKAGPAKGFTGNGTKPAAKEFQTAFHGTPHVFDKFSTDKIGTGEGNTSFGWGLYFASQKEVAETYRDALAGGGNGNMVKVDVPEDSDLMVWERPLNRQPAAVKAAIRRMRAPKAGLFSRAITKFRSERLASYFAGQQWAETTGMELYGALRLALGSDRAASLALRDAGIPGHRYLDGNSRAAGDGSYNYVIYDDSRVSVLGSDLTLPEAPYWQEHDDGFQYSVAPAASRTVTESRVIKELDGRLTDIQPAILKTIPLNYFTELARENMTAVGDYLKVKRQLDSYRGKKHAASDEIAQEWLKFARLGFGKDGKAKAAALADIMHEATLAGVDPSKTDSESRAHPDYDRLRKAFMALPPTGRELFAKVRDAYKRQADELDKILLDNVKKAQEIARNRAEKQYKDDIARIERTRMSPAERRNALDEAESAYKAAATKAQWSMKARLTKMRIAFEASRVPEPYFPLARYGRYFVVVRDVNGEVLSFSRRERAADRNRLAADMRKAFPTAKVEVGVADANADVRQAMDPRLVAEIEQIVGGAGLDGSTTTAVLDQIWQRYLQTMPDLSVRKRFIHRKGVAGFDADALRAFSSHMFHAAHQMARLKYGLELQELTNEAAEQARESDDPTKGTTLSNELKQRHKWVMNPTGSSVAQTMTSAAFVWYLATSPAAAIVNLTQTPMLGIPILAGRFGGFAKASVAMTRAMVDSVRGRGSITNANLSADERAAIERFYETGLIDRTQSHDLAGVGETGVNYSPLRARVMAAMSWAFHRAEVWNREVTALAAYRMARDSGQNQMQAIDTAHDLTWKTHFDYSNSSRPSVLQNDFAKVALVFRAYNINMLYRFFRDIRQTFRGETPQARREARYQLAGITGMMTLFAGAQGVIGFNVMMALAGMLFGDDDDPMDFQQTFRKDVLDILGPELGGVVLDGVPGHYLGIDLTQRIGMPDLWFRSPSRDLQGQDEYEYWVFNSLGAAVSLGGDIYRGLDMIYNGETERGVEAIAPKWARDLLKSYRYANEGLASLRGDQMLEADQFGAWDVIAQSMGFTPAKVAETYERNNALKNAEKRVLDRRRQLVNAFAMAHVAGDPDAKEEALAAIKTFNATPSYRPLAITTDTLRQSLRTRQRNAAKREDGVLIQNRQLGKQLREALPEAIYR